MKKLSQIFLEKKLRNEYISKFKGIKTPFYLFDEVELLHNLKVLKEVKEASGCKILLAQKAFSLYQLYNKIFTYLDGTCASGYHEARLAKEYFVGENHVFCTAFSEEEFLQCLNYCDFIIFNSLSQKKRFADKAHQSNKVIGLRVNPEVQTQKNAIYDPCRRYSRHGILAKDLTDSEFEYVSMLHFHTLCEQNSDALKTTLDGFVDKFSKYFKYIKFVNFGGGHHITKEGYDIPQLISIIKDFSKRYELNVYLEPGEAVVLNSGYLICKVLDIVKNEKNIAIVDTSAECHAPDCIEMPYQPKIASQSDNGKYEYILGSSSCLAGDIFGNYCFDEPLNIGDYLIFMDMAMYTFVKNNTFNGINLPSFVLREENDNLSILKEFNYNDFRSRL